MMMVIILLDMKEIQAASFSDQFYDGTWYLMYLQF